MKMGKKTSMGIGLGFVFGMMALAIVPAKDVVKPVKADDKTFKAVYYHGGDARDLTFYYDNENHSGADVTVYDNVHYSGTSWGYSGSADVFKTVTIDESVKDYHGLTSTHKMFFNMQDCSSIKGLEYLDVSNVTDMNSMFAQFAYDVNGDIEIDLFSIKDWNTSNVTDMGSMFSNFARNSKTFNDVPDVSKWDTTKVTDMSYMFCEYASASTVFNCVPDVSDWNTSNVVNMDCMFYNYAYHSLALDKNVDVSNWDTSKLVKLQSIFENYGYDSTKLAFYLDISLWDLTSAGCVTNSTFGKYAGKNGTSWTVLIASKTGNLTNTTGSLYLSEERYYFSPSGSKSFTITYKISNCFPEKDYETNHCYFEVKKSAAVEEKVTIIPHLEENYRLIESSLYTSYSRMGTYDALFDHYKNDDGSFYFNMPPGDVEITCEVEDSTKPTFKAVRYYDNGRSDLVFYYDTVDYRSKTTDYYNNVDYNESGRSWDYDGEIIKTVTIDESVKNYHGLKSTARMFAGMKKIQSITGLEYLDVSNVTSMESMFDSFGYNVTGETNYDFSGMLTWDTSNVTSMKCMFEDFMYKSESYDGMPDVSNFDTSKVTTMNCMFNRYAYSSKVLTKCPDVSNWKTPALTDILSSFTYYGFNSELLNFYLDMSGWDFTHTTGVTQGQAFEYCGKNGLSWSAVIPSMTGSYQNDSSFLCLGDGKHISRGYTHEGDGFILAYKINNGCKIDDAEDNNGYLDLKVASPEKATVVINVVPNKGYWIDKTSLVVSYNDGEDKTVEVKEESGVLSFEMPAYDVTINCDFITATPTVTFDENGGDTGASPASIEQTFGSAYSLPTTEPTKEGYTFDGWYTAATEGDKVTAATIVENSENHTLYAHWSANTYTVKYRQSAEDDTDEKSFDVLYDEEHVIIAKPEEWTKTGYSFAGWTPDGSMIFEVGDEVYSLAPSGDFILYPAWVANEYTVTYHANGGVGKDYVQDLRYDEKDTVVNAETAGFSRDHYVLTGWVDGDGKEFDFGDEILNWCTESEENFDLYAVWEQTEVVITLPFDVDGLTFEVTDVTASAKISKETGTDSDYVLPIGHKIEIKAIAADRYSIVGTNPYVIEEVTSSTVVKAEDLPTVKSEACEYTAPTGVEWTYNGTDLVLVDTTSATTEKGEFRYSLTATGTYSAELPTAKDAGTYTVYWKIVDPTDVYVFARGDFESVINKELVAKPAADTTTFVYDGNEKTYGIEEMPLVYEITGNKQTNVGQYEVTVSLIDTKNFAWADESIDDLTYNFVIAKGAPVYTAPSAKTIAYTGEVQELVTAGVSEHGTFTYSFIKDGTYSADIPTAIDAGTYTVYWKFAGDANHQDASGTIVVELAKATTVINVDTTAIVKVVGEDITLPTATSNFGTVKCDKAASDLVNPGKYTVTYSVDGTNNYTSDIKTVSVTINQKAENVVVKDANGKVITNPTVTLVSAEKGIDPNASLIVGTKDLTNPDETKNATDVLSANGKLTENEQIFGIYDVKLSANGVDVQPDGSVTLSMYIPQELQGKEYKIYHIHGTELVEVTNFTSTDGKHIKFSVSNFSEFVFVGEKPVEPPTKPQGLSGGAVAGISVGSVAGASGIATGLYFFIRKRH